MRLSLKNLGFAVCHPRTTLRYIRHRDSIACDCIAKFIPKDPVILEAGAANGSNTLEMAGFWPNARIHAFEPVPGAREILKQATSSLGERVSIHSVALGETPGVFKMWVSGSGGGDSQSSSLLTPLGHESEYQFVKFGGQIDVQVKTIDGWASENGIEKIDFMWLDLQGNELNALRGASRVLAAVSAIHMEVCRVRLYEGAPLRDEVFAFMAQKGFEARVDATFRVGGNVLFTRR